MYDQLREVAHQRLLGERSDHTLNTTALVHEAYIRLVDLDGMQWRDRMHFLAMASRLMRRVLVDYARERKAAKRGGRQFRITLEDADLLLETQADTILELDEDLTDGTMRFNLMRRTCFHSTTCCQVRNDWSWWKEGTSLQPGSAFR